MIAGRHLTLVTERDESWGAFEAFERAFAAGADLFRDRVVGFQRGTQRAGASLMTRVDAADGAGSSPRMLVGCNVTMQHR
jgi:hypothetical protein